jgi:hypothetical protein
MYLATFLVCRFGEKCVDVHTKRSLDTCVSLAKYFLFEANLAIVCVWWKYRYTSNEA